MAYSSQLGKLLIVDDDSNIADLLSINLGSEGYGITLENKASKAAEYDLRDYRLVLADCMNQAFTGFDLLDHIKSIPSLGHVGVIICSSSDRENDIIRALDSGADDYIVKPFSLRELVARISRCFAVTPSVRIQSAIRAHCSDSTIYAWICARAK